MRSSSVASGSVTSRNCMSSSVITPPIVPMRLIMAFALLRIGLGVTSGISATAGERYRHMNTSVNAVAASISARQNRWILW